MREKINLIPEPLGAAQHPDYPREIAGILRSTLMPQVMKERILAYHEKDIAAAMELLSREERGRLYNILDDRPLADILEYSGQLGQYIGEVSLPRQADLLSQFEAAAAVECLAGMEKPERSALLELMDQETRQAILLLSSFDDGEIGSRMSTNYVCVTAGSSVRQAMRALIDQAEEHDNISTLYVVGEDQTLMGAIELKKLIIAREYTRLEDITMLSYPYVYAGESIDACVERIKDYSEDSIPVLTGDNKLCGVLTCQEITQMVDDVLGDDYAKLAGLSAEEDLREPLGQSIRKRLPWLVLLLALGLVVSGVVGAFEQVVAHLAILVSFQSLILDMSGNVGTQSLAVTIRVLMDEQLGGKQRRALIRKEVRVGLANGLILAVLSAGLIGGYLILFKGQAPLFALWAALCAGAALLLAVLLSSLSGTVIPVLFQWLKVDPAVASGPLITTINDLIAVVSYYGLSWLFLMELLGF